MTCLELLVPEMLWGRIQKFENVTTNATLASRWMQFGNHLRERFFSNLLPTAKIDKLIIAEFVQFVAIMEYAQRSAVAWERRS